MRNSFANDTKARPLTTTAGSNLKAQPMRKEMPHIDDHRDSFPSPPNIGRQMPGAARPKGKNTDFPSYSHRWPILTTSLERPWAERNGVT